MRCFLFFAVLILITLPSCNGPECHNKNQVFNSESFESQQYQQELAKYLKGQDQTLFSYWVKEYVEKGKHSFIIVSIKGKDFCAKALLEIPESGPLKPVKDSKGQGYMGAELDGLTFDIQETSDGARLIYKNVEGIID